MPRSRSRSLRVHHALGHLLVVAEDVGLLQHAVDQRGLAVVDVGDDGDVADVLPCFLHLGQPRVNKRPACERPGAVFRSGFLPDHTRKGRRCWDRRVGIPGLNHPSAVQNPSVDMRLPALEAEAKVRAIGLVAKGFDVRSSTWACGYRAACMARCISALPRPWPRSARDDHVLDAGAEAGRDAVEDQRRRSRGWHLAEARASNRWTRSSSSTAAVGPARAVAVWAELRIRRPSPPPDREWGEWRVRSYAAWWGMR